jgi:uncharacterized protein YkwD
MKSSKKTIAILITALAILACSPALPAAEIIPTPTESSAPPTATLESPSLPTLIPSPTPIPGPIPPDYDPDALAAIARINEWRMSQGLWPLRLNDTLKKLAEDQVAYLLTLPALPEGGDIHIGPQGDLPDRRAFRADWPHYATAQQVAVGEIAYVGDNLDAAMDFWQNSPIHNATATHTAYREIGAAALPHPLGHLWIIDFGSRPDVLPALIEPLSGMLLLSNEQYHWSKGGLWIHQAAQVQIVTSPTGQTDSTAWQAWSAALPAPQTGGQPFYVVYTDGSKQTRVEVNPASDIAWLPGSLVGASAPAAQAVIPTVAAPITGNSVSVLYDYQSLVIVNTSPGPVDVRGLEVAGSGESLPAMLWDTQWLGAPLELFPAGSCLQVWALGRGDPGTPFQCKIRQSVIYVQPGQDFWRQAEFEIRWQGAMIGRCGVGDGMCSALLPSP